MTIEFFTGTPGSGKSYHALEEVVDALDKGKYVIANFPINFTDKMITNGQAGRFMYIPDDFLMGDKGMALLYKISVEQGFFDEESSCLVVIDEAGNYFSPEDVHKPEQKMWRLFFRQHRKLGYDFLLISQGNRDINRAILSCVEYEVAHRKANRVRPFKWLPWTFFVYVRYWRSDGKRQLLGSESAIFVKRFAALYDTTMMFGGFEEKMEFDFSDIPTEFDIRFGNTIKFIIGDDDDDEKQTLEIEHTD